MGQRQRQRTAPTTLLASIKLLSEVDMQRRNLALLTFFAIFCAPVHLWAHEDERAGSAGSEHLGEVSFPISCNAAAQREFNRGGTFLFSREALSHDCVYPDYHYLISA